MSPSVRISSAQLISLVAIFNEVAALLFLPTSMAREAGPDAWIAVIVGIAAGTLPGALCLSYLARRHPHTGFCRLTETCLGRWPGKVACLLLAGLSLWICSLVLRNVMDFGMVALLPGTPMVVIGGLMAATVGYAAWSGGEVIARLSVLVLILIIVSLLFMGAGLLPDLQLVRIQPVLGHGFMPVLRAAVPLTGWTAEYLIMAPFIPMVDRPRKTLSAILWGSGLAILMLGGLVIWSLLAFSPGLVQKFTYPTFSLARQVTIGQFLERLDIALVTVWLSGMVVKAAVCLWGAVQCLAGTVGLKRDYYLAPLLAAAALALTMIWPSQMAQAAYSVKLSHWILTPFEIGLPLLLVLGSRLRAGSMRRASA